MNNPRDLGVPHDEWRPNQLAAYQATKEIFDTGETKHVFLELGTGSGKSGIATALGAHQPVVVLVQTLSLLDQYEEAYGFEIIKGRQEYDCVLEEKTREWKAKTGFAPKASDCHFPKMHDCPVAHRCPYLIAKQRALSSKRMACTYRYASLSHKVAEREGIVILDEAHAAGEEVLSFAEFNMTEERRRKFNLPPLPFPTGYGPQGKGDLIDAKARGVIKDWIAESRSALRALKGIEAASDRQSQVKRMYDRLSRLSSDIGDDRQDWFLYQGSGNMPTGSWQTFDLVNRAPTYMNLRPLSARPIAPVLWKSKDLAVLMSATIGDPDPLANELAIEDYKAIDFPHPIPPEFRPVDDLHVPRMTRSNINDNPNLYEVQAVSIWNWVRQLDPSWRGIVLTTSYTKINELKKHLKSRFNGRIYEPPDNARGVTARVNAFLADPRPGLIAIDTIQGWGHGIDLYGDLARFAVVAGVPHSNPSDPYERARTSRPGGRKYAWWTAYNAIPQAVGRVSRGEKDEHGEWIINRAALADGSATAPTAFRYFPQWFREAIRR
jgi:Rad3-related DNA helicase